MSGTDEHAGAGPGAGGGGAEPELGAVTTTSSGSGELFGVHIPELQLPEADFRAGMRAARLAPGERYLELGSGHGRGLVIAAVEFEAHATGVEYVEEAIARTNAAAATAGVAVEVLRADLLHADVGQADVVHMHLGPAFHDVLADRLEVLLQPDARVIAAGWRVPGWLPLEGHDDIDAYGTGYVYRPADPDMHVSWGERHETVVELHVHASLTSIEVRVDGDAGTLAAVSSTRAGRGQQVLVDLPTGRHRSLVVWARSPGGRFAPRGGGFVYTRREPDASPQP